MGARGRGGPVGAGEGVSIMRQVKIVTISSRNAQHLRPPSQQASPQHHSSPPPTPSPGIHPPTHPPKQPKKNPPKRQREKYSQPSPNQHTPPDPTPPPAFPPGASAAWTAPSTSRPRALPRPPSPLFSPRPPAPSNYLPAGLAWLRERATSSEVVCCKSWASVGSISLFGDCLLMWGGGSEMTGLG